MNVLLSRTDRIGDLILSTPAIASVRKSFPSARITMVCSPYNSVVMERNSDVDEVIHLPPDVSPRSFGRRFRGTVDVAIALAPRAADIALVGATRAKTRVGYTYVRRYTARLSAMFQLTRTMLSEADPYLAERTPNLRIRHEVEQLLDLVELAGADQRVTALRLDVTQEDRAALDYLPKDPLVMHLGARWFSSGSTLDSTIELIRALGRFGLPVVVTYAPESGRYVERIAEARVADVLLGGLPFYRWAAVFERARVIVTVDTGATHVASAMRRPTVVAFEHRYFRLNSQEWSPYGVPNVLVRKPDKEDEASLTRFRGEISQAVAELLHA
ncbi:MAG: glycosyltransferase family 9 protein [Candidatus Eremiobacteraeota bacterium]|nr:glycosyltransferase family 9 protein [Candidatus Eremiobacteraeota bacterium]